MPEPLLVIRVDASPEIGTGHVMRCLALAQGWQDAGGQAVFATTHELPPLEQRLLSEGFRIERLSVQPGGVEDAAQTGDLASRNNAAWVVLDGYHFRADYQHSLKAAGHRVFLIDDFGHSEHYFADFVLDQNLGTREALYRDGEPYTELLLGPQYALLRREFRAWGEWKRDFSAPARLLITLGGADPGGMTLRILEALKDVPIENLETTVLMGTANPNCSQIEAAARANLQIRLLHNVANMPYEMARTDIAVIAAGGTLWELLYMGNCVLSYSRNQVQADVLSELASTGTVSWLGPVEGFNSERLVAKIVQLANDRDRRRSTSSRARAVVDGSGVIRVLQALGIEALESDNAVRLVAVSPTEKDEFMRMARQHFSELNPAFTPQADWNDHYFESVQSNPNYSLRWMMNGDQRAGFILFGVESHRFLPRRTGMIYEVYVVPEHRRKGIARLCARQAIAELRSFCPSKLQLETVEGNEKANFLWHSMGFRRVSERFVLQDGRS